MFSQSFGADVYGTKARVIRIEADVSDGLPVFDMVGFLDTLHHLHQRRKLEDSL